jgi:predicted TIM-barrel fold metal-dependent hydrolase
MRKILVVLLSMASVSLAADSHAQFLAEIASIPAIDNHAHPVCPPATVPGDRDFDALPVDSLEPESDPVMARPGNPELAMAWKALFNAGATDLQQKRAAVQKARGATYSVWVLDQAKVQVMLANRVSMCEGIAKPRFAWVPYADALLFPLDNSKLAGDNPDRKVYVPLEQKVLRRYLAQRGMQSAPAKLKEYLEQVVTPTLEEQRRGGAVAEKFEIAYLRKFDFGDPARSEAERVYTEGQTDGAPSQADYKILQDYLFRYIVLECGRLGMAVHLHTMAGAGGYFDVAGVNPLLLEPVLNDPTMRKTKFVFVHGGWPYTREIGALLEKPNVYLDFSSQSLSIPPATLAVTLREWMERNPEKVLYGTDAYPQSETMGWEEALWMANRNGREALALALEAMERDNQVTHEQALKIAHQVLHDNAAGMYGL